MTVWHQVNHLCPEHYYDQFDAQEARLHIVADLLDITNHQLPPAVESHLVELRRYLISTWTKE